MYRIDGCSIEAAKSCYFGSHIVSKEKQMALGERVSREMEFWVEFTLLRHITDISTEYTIHDLLLLLLRYTKVL